MFEIRIGSKVKIVGDHPHSGEYGEIESIERTPAGKGIKIRLEDGEGCFVFDMSNLRGV